ncbi:hypothetical protein Ahy_B01g051767 isoform A [Arachis hypogaea]|uniref:Protein FAR1-RELATED SEQUENCE n=1 Tax=Arachis hypogaea TaxID=3818 RepID=A0A445AN02_ARAHY|nr:hypothetical protein Ahy_B01g051767 isoform A [Arachis hypogaea]
MVLKLELKHTHACSAKRSFHCHEYRELTMHTKCPVIQPNKTYLALANEIGGSSNLSHSEKNVRNYITCNLRYVDDNTDMFVVMQLSVHDCAFYIFVFVDLYEDRQMWVLIFFQCEFWADMRSTQRSERTKELENDAANSKGVISYSSSSTIKRQFQQEYISFMFREVQQEFRKKGDCLIHGMTQEGDSSHVNVDKQFLLYGKSRYCTNSVDFDLLTAKFDASATCLNQETEYYLALFSLVGARMYSASTLTDFVTCDEEEAMLNSALDDMRAMIVDYHANLGSKNVAGTQNNMAT